MKLSNDPVKLPLNASPLRPAEGENIGPASLANLRSALCTEYRLPDDTDRCKAWLSLREGWDTEKQKSKKMNEMQISWLVYYYLSANFIFRKRWHTLKYINKKKIWHKNLVLDNFNRTDVITIFVKNLYTYANIQQRCNVSITEAALEDILTV